MFFKSKDKKYVFKELVKSDEIKQFLKLSQGYFDYMCKSFFHQQPSCLVKIIGAFKIVTGET